MRRSRAECDEIDQSFWSWMITSSSFVYFTADETDTSVFAGNKDDGSSRALQGEIDSRSTILSLSMTVPFLALQSGAGAKVIPWNLLLRKALRTDVSKEGTLIFHIRTPLFCSIEADAYCL